MLAVLSLLGNSGFIHFQMTDSDFGKQDRITDNEISEWHTETEFRTTAHGFPFAILKTKHSEKLCVLCVSIENADCYGNESTQPSQLSSNLSPS